MRLLRQSFDGKFIPHEFIGDHVPPYAILSHAWGKSHDEVNFKDILRGTGRNKAGYDKLRFCANQAACDGLEYFWMDSCCVNSSNSSEIAEAINSMFGLYRNATKCYVYLGDVSMDQSDQSWELQFRNSRWFTRGWTLQELLAPSSVEFFDMHGERLGSKRTLEQQIHEITGIAIQALRGAPLYQFSIEERLSWRHRRETTRKEDASYCLFGIFDVNLPVIYGEGTDKAFRRLMVEIDSSRVSLTPSTAMKIYHPLRGSGFRILILNPGVEGSEITGYIQEFDLLEPPEYNAVSYVWGHEPAIHRIDINHRQIFIRPNLFQALQRMRNRTYPVFLWVDSLCINQSDKIERSAQVRRMADIFQNANHVWIWLGEEDSTSKIAMDFIPQMISLDFRWCGAWWKEPHFTAFDDLLGRSWFRRRWVIQEAAFSPNPVIICGSSRVHMNDFARAVSLVQAKLGSISLSFHVTDMGMSHENSLVNFRDSPATRLLDIIRAVFHRSNDGAILTRKLSLETLVDLAMFCETSEQQDTIFALLTMANDVESPSHPDFTTPIVVDYNSNPLDVFAQFILHCCLKSDSLDILCRPWAPISHSTGYTKGQAGRVDRIDQSSFPSWIATKHDIPFGNPSWGMTNLLHSKSLVGNSLKRIYNAHYDTKPQVHLGRNDSMNTYDGSFYAKGIILGEITQRSTRMADSIITNDCLGLLGMDFLDQQLNPVNLLDAIWRTLCANRNNEGELAPLAFRSAMVQVLQLSSNATITGDRLHQVNVVSSIDVKELLETELPEEVENFLKSTRNVVWNRRTFRGKRNSSDGGLLVGLIPQYAKAGDQLCILYGCSAPVVLRKRSRNDSSHHWQLIGEAYVDGFMEGEGISCMPPTALKSAEIEFEIR